MKRIVGLALLILASSGAVVAAENSQTFYLSSDVRVGKVQLPRGICEVTWNTRLPGPQVQLTVKTDDRKTVIIPARMARGKQTRVGVVTNVVNGVVYLVELHTRNAKFTFENSKEVPK